MARIWRTSQPVRNMLERFSHADLEQFAAEQGCCESQECSRAELIQMLDNELPETTDNEFEW